MEEDRKISYVKDLVKARDLKIGDVIYTHITKNLSIEKSIALIVKIINPGTIPLARFRDRHTTFDDSYVDIHMLCNGRLKIDKSVYSGEFRILVFKAQGQHTLEKKQRTLVIGDVLNVLNLMTLKQEISSVKQHRCGRGEKMNHIDKPKYNPGTLIFMKNRSEYMPNKNCLVLIIAYTGEFYIVLDHHDMKIKKWSWVPLSEIVSTINNEKT